MFTFAPKVDFMVDIIADPKAISDSKIHPMVIERACEMLRQKFESSPEDMPRAKKKWQEIVVVAGMRLVMNCHRENGKIAVTGIRKTRLQKVKVRRGR